MPTADPVPTSLSSPIAQPGARGQTGQDCSLRGRGKWRHRAIQRSGEKHVRIESAFDQFSRAVLQLLQRWVEETQNAVGARLLLFVEKDRTQSLQPTAGEGGEASGKIDPTSCVAFFPSLGPEQIHPIPAVHQGRGIAESETRSKRSAE